MAHTAQFTISVCYIYSLDLAVVSLQAWCAALKLASHDFCKQESIETFDVWKIIVYRRSNGTVINNCTVDLSQKLLFASFKFTLCRAPGEMEISPTADSFKE